MFRIFSSLIFALSLFLMPINAQDFNGVFVGINLYPDQQHTVFVWDAQDMRGRLHTYCGWSFDKMTLLVNEYATKQGITSAISSMSRSAANTDMFYFSGDGSTSGAYTVDEQYLSPTELQSTFGSTYGYYAVFIDAGHSGVFATGMSNGVISTACKSDEDAGWHSPGGDHSTFTSFLCQGLQNNCSSAEALHNYAAPLTTQWEPTSHPQIGDYFSGELYLKSYTVSGTIQSNQTWVGSVSLTGNLSVATGATLRIKSGATVNFSGYSIVSSGGTIILESGTASAVAALKTGSTTNGLYGTLQSAANAASSGQTIQLSANTFYENPTINNKNNLTITGSPGSSVLSGTMVLNNCPGFYVDNITCIGLQAYDCDGSQFRANISGSPYSNGIYLYSCSSFQLSGNINNSSSGLYSLTSDGEVQANAYFQNNYTGITSASSSAVECWWSIICPTINYDLFATQYAYILAQDCFYTDGLPRTLELRGGAVYLSGVYSCQYLPKISSLPTKSKLPSQDNKIQASDPTRSQFSEVMDPYFALNRDIEEDIKVKGKFESEKFLDRFAQVTSNFKSFIKDHPDSPMARVALATSACSHWRFQDYLAKKDFLDDILKDEKLTSVRDLAEFLLIDYYKDIKDYENLVKAADDFIQNHGNDEDLVTQAIFEKGMVQWLDLNQPQKATECLAAIVRDYPKTPIADLAKAELEICSQQPKESPDKESTEACSPLNLGSYPNPFNPTAVVAYTLPIAGHVTLKVYDVLGREVKTLVDRVEEKGLHTVTFDGSSLSSGTYLCRLQIKPEGGGKTLLQTNKIVLMK